MMAQTRVIMNGVADDFLDEIVDGLAAEWAMREERAI